MRTLAARAAAAALLLAAMLAAASAAPSPAGAPPALVEEQEGQRVWFHLDNLLQQQQGGQAADQQEQEEPVAGETKEGAVKDKTGGSTTVLANKNQMSIMEDAEGRELSPHLAAREGRMEAHEAARKREAEGARKRSGEANQKHKRHLQARRAARQRELEAATAKGRALEEVRKAQAKTAELNKKTAQLRKKVQEQNAKKAAKAWRFAAGWTDYGHSYGRVRVDKVGNVCQLTGLVRRTSRTANRIIGTVPEACRPGGQLLFTVKVGRPRSRAGNRDQSRIDILRDGRVHLTAALEGVTNTYWVALSGVRWNVGTPGTALSFVNGWRNYGGPFRGAGVAVEKKQGGTLCTLSGLIRHGRWGYFGRVPAGECYPQHRLIFNANNHRRVTRLDMLNNGYILRAGGAAGHGWVALDGAVYPGRGSRGVNLPLTSSYRHYDNRVFGPARYHRIGNVCMLTGLVTRTRGNKATAAYIARLPRGCRPKQRLIFAVNTHTFTARVDVHSNGWVQHVGGSYASWLSLSGVNFIARH